MAHYNTAHQELIGILLPGFLIEHRNIARHSTAQHCTAQQQEMRKQISMQILRPRHDTQIDRSRICYVCIAIFAWQSNQRCQHSSTIVSTATRDAEAISTAALCTRREAIIYRTILYIISYIISCPILYIIFHISYMHMISFPTF